MSINLPQEPKQIALIKPSALGDIVHSLPVLTALRNRFPAAQIAWVVNRAYAPLLHGHPDLDEIIPFDRGALKVGFLHGGVSFARLMHDLRKRRFDLTIDLQGLLRTGLMTMATRAPVRIGLASAREGAAMCYTHRIDDRAGATHAVDRYWRVAEAFGAPSHKSFHVPIDLEARAWARERLQSYPRPLLAIGAGSRWLTKRWPPGHFAELARRVQERFGGTAVFVGAPEEAKLADETAALLRGPVCRLTGKTTLPQLVGVLAEVDAMLANDTGPLHLAAALGRPVVAPYTCTLSEKTGPYGQLSRAVETAIWCKGSYVKTCARLECMDELTPDRVWPALEGILRTWLKQPHAA